MILSAKKFNKLQDQKYFEYCQKCKKNKIIPQNQNRYFYKIPVKYGFVYQNSFNEIFWKKRKSDFNL